MRCRRGSSLVIMMLIATILGGLLAAVGATSMFHLKSSREGEKRIKQEMAARAGLQHALVTLRNDKAHSTPLSGTLKNGYSYEVTFDNNESGNLGPDYQANDGTPVGPGHVYLRSSASQPGGQGLTLSYSAQAWQPPVTVNTAAFGEDSVRVADSTVTHWSKGAPPSEFMPPGTLAEQQFGFVLAAGMGSAGRPPQMELSAKFTKALLGTNSSSMDSLWAEGDTEINGNIAYGEGSPVTAKSGIVSVIGANSGAQSDAGLSPFAPSTGPNDNVKRVSDTVKLKGDVEVFAQTIPFPQRPEISGYGSDELISQASTLAGGTVSADTNALSSANSAAMNSSAASQNSTSFGTTNPQDFAQGQVENETVISPGRYGELKLEPGAILRLEAGEYEIDSLDMEQATLLVDNESQQPTILTVKENFRAKNSEINRFRHATQAYSPNTVWTKQDLEAQSGNPEKLELYFQGERVSTDSQKMKESEFELENSFLSSAVVGKATRANVEGGALHGAFMTQDIALKGTKLYHAKTFQNPNKAVSSKGPWTLKATSRTGLVDSGTDLEENDPWSAIEDAWYSQYK